MAMTFDMSDVDDTLGDMKDRVKAAAKMIASAEAVSLESYMKRKRPWTDRTGRAKGALSATVSEPNDTTIRITLAHGVSYGKYLELANEGKYRIIKPTLDTEGKKVIEKFNGFLDKLG